MSCSDWLEVAAVIAVLSVVTWGVHKLREPQTLPIRQVHFEQGPVNASQAQLVKTVAPYLSGGFFTIDLLGIERALTRLAWVKSASVRRQWPHGLSIRLREHVPVARWGSDALLSRDGRVFRPELRKLPTDLPVLHGPKGRARHLLARYRQIVAMLAPARMRIRALVEDERRAWHLLLNNGITVAVGRGDPRARIGRFARVFPQVLAGQVRYIESIDLRYTNGLAVAWKRTDDASSVRTGATVY
jgi:cell division protein FtsQ